MAFAFDTLVQSKRLREAGFDERQAEALTAVLRDAVKPFDASELATKADLAREISALRADLTEEIPAVRADLTHEIAAVRADLTHEITAVRTDLTHEITALRADLTHEIAAVRADLVARISETRADLLQWFIGLIAGAVVLNAFVVVGSILGLLRLSGH